MELLDAIYQRRSVRQFLPKAVGRADLEKIVAAGIEAPSGCNMQLRRYIIVDDPAVMARLVPISGVLATAPACVAVVVKPTASPYGEYWRQDASASIQNMLLAETAMGLGGCWIEGPLARHDVKFREILRLPDDVKLCGIISVGYPAQAPARPAKSELKSVTYYNGYGEIH